MDQPGRHDSLLAAFEKSEVDLAEVAPIVTKLHPADAAELFGELDGDSRWGFFALLDNSQKTELISHLPHSDAAAALTHLPSSEHVLIINALSDDDLVDILQEMDPTQRSRCLHLLPESKKKVAKTLLLYPEDSAGGRMTTALAAVQ
ncbi:MAG: hypothetical protein P8J87_18945, partial [Verrucomicrobiales bacterium]|nr:hypothetical protein [Verrucomicrobiales bacterium]